MVCNYLASAQSKERCILGGTLHEPIQSTKQKFAQAPHACRAVAVARRIASRSGAPSKGFAHHGEQMERTAATGRLASARSTPAGSSFGTRCRATSHTRTLTEGRGIGPRFCNGAVDVAASGAVDQEGICTPIQREPSLAHPDVAGIYV